MLTNQKQIYSTKLTCSIWGGRVVRWSWINFQVRGVLLVWIRVGQGPTALAVGAGGGCLDIFTLIYPFSFLSPTLWETTRYRLKYCLKGSLSPKTTNQPTCSIKHSMPLSENIILQSCHLSSTSKFPDFSLTIYGFPYPFHGSKS